MRNLDTTYLKMAKIWSENSYAKKLKVGAIIVKNGVIISDGYNGTIAGFDNVCEDENGNTYSHVLHAEANAISKIAKSTYSSENASIYTTHSPCIECAKLIIQCGIKEVYYLQDYRQTDGLELLKKSGVFVEKIKI